MKKLFENWNKYLNETAHRDEINEGRPLLEFGSVRNPPGPENRAEYALTWALGQRGGGLDGQEITLDDIISLLTSPGVAEIYQRLQNPSDQSPFTPEQAVNHVKRLLSPRGQQMRHAHATGRAFGVVEPDHETGDKTSDGLIYYFSPGIKDPTKIIWHGTGKQGGEAPRFKESRLDEQPGGQQRQRFLNPQQAKKYLAKAIYMSLRDSRAYTADSAMSLEGLIGGGNNSAVVRYLKEFGLDDKGIKTAMDQRTEYIRGAGATRPPVIPRPTGDDTAPSEWEVLKYAKTATGDQGVYMEKASG